MDAFIASIIIVSSLALFMNLFSIEEDPYQSFLLAEDFTVFLENTVISDYSGDVMYDLIDKGLVPDTSKTLLEEVVLLYNDGSPESLGNATLLFEEFASLAPSNVGINFSIDSTSLYSTMSTSEPHMNLASQRVVTIVDDAKIIGPFIFEVQLWR